MIQALAPLLGLLALQSTPGVDADVHRQFDFWVGQWSVQNRRLQADGTWRDEELARAQITPVCGDRALLEQWVGPEMNGFSLRAFDPEREAWTILLFWTTDGSSGFGRMFGRFRHGRGEFFPTLAAGQRSLTRFTFSDGLAASCRWDSATTNDGGVSWKTDWIMEFSRTRAASQVTQAQLFAEDWNARACSPQAEARELDWTVGRWEGVATELASGEQREARFRSRVVNGDTLIFDVLATRAQGEEAWHERAVVRGWCAPAQRWEAWRVDQEDTVLRSSVGEHDADVFAYSSPRQQAALSPGRLAREVLVRLGEDELLIEEAVWPAAGGEPEASRVIELSRVAQR